MDPHSSQLIVEPVAHPRLIAFCDSVKRTAPIDELPTRWEIQGVCYCPESELKALELRHNDNVLPADVSIGLPSPAFSAKHSRLPGSTAARFSMLFDTELPRHLPWLQLHARFADGEVPFAHIHLVENHRADVDAPFVSTVHYRNELFRFYVSNINDSIQGQYHSKGRFYELDLLEFVCATCPNHALVADVGANVGNHAVYFDKVFGAREVVVFEPNEVANAILLKNIGLNDCRRINTRYVQYGVSDASGRYRVGTMPENNLGGTKLIADSAGPIKSVRLDDVLGGLRVGLLKIDVEGMEMSVLKSAAALIAAAAPVIAVEVTPQSVDEVQSFLNGHGYRIERTFSMYVDIATLIAVPVGIFSTR